MDKRLHLSQAQVALAFLGLLAGSLLAACMSPSGACTLDNDAVLAYATAYCERLERCDPHELDARFGGRSICIARRSLLCPPCRFTTAAAVKGCADALRTASCGPAGDPPACRLNSNPEGAPCTASAACAAGLVCDRSSRCARPVLSEAGGACGSQDNTTICQDGLVCTGGACAAPAQKGEPCGSGAPACDPQQRLFCDPRSNTCEPHSPMGGFCGLPGFVQTLCPTAGACVHCGSTNWSCHPRVADGEPCGSCFASGRGVCFEPSVCIGGRCTPPVQQSCQKDE